MCYAVFIGTPEKHIVGQFVPNHTTIYFDKVDPEAEPFIRPKFKSPFIYYVGSDTSCSCGLDFQSEHFHDSVWQEHKQSPQAFLDFLKEQTQRHEVEYYYCWDGDWEDEPDERLELSVGSITLDKNYFGLIEGQFIRFKKD